jgi:hypothetical protein
LTTSFDTEVAHVNDFLRHKRLLEYAHSTGIRRSGKGQKDRWGCDLRKPLRISRRTSDFVCIGGV